MFEDQQNPQVVVRVGEREVDSNDGKTVEITDVVFTTVGPAAGAIVVEWNVGRVEHGKPPGGLWDSHIRWVWFSMYTLAHETRLQRFKGWVEVRLNP